MSALFSFNSLWPKNTLLAVKIKDIILVVGFVITIAGWYRSSVIEKSKMNSQIEIVRNDIKNISSAVDLNTQQLIEVNKQIMQQNELNGKIILFMELKK